ncbi:ATP-dependent helicase HrpB [Granulicella sibirica]|uniref:ATP-dependent helicase HrpB n=1 Tax=Granulicella sibirica TaxID=2479048 RepID=A0A4Q0SZY2_9BACT|nr:ATP-dependent helicase HrpB [Granulicella sibirica]RXH56893.1 ATP-dependent helicase HrpB [Granulicella sibirica]
MDLFPYASPRQSSPNHVSIKDVIRKAALPVDAIVPEMLSSLARTPSLVIEAPPGAGKTTRVPPALLGLVSGEVIVLEPRRIAARMAARRVAWEMEEEAGETVGYQVRFEEVVSPHTRLRFVTEGILTRRLMSDPTLKGVEAVVLDEFHERHLDGDLALALLKRLQRTRPTLRLIVMSATLDAAPIARYLGDCPVLRSEGRLFPLTVRHLPYSPDPLHLQVKKAVDLLLKEKHPGNILTFLPGAAEIRRSMRELEPIARQTGMLVVPLHGDLSPAEQDRAVSPSPEQRIILATNVAESSVTVEGVTAVIDSGLARIATYSPWTGLPTLQIGRVSRASATQRAGRAGRTGPGRVLRLYPEEDYVRRLEHDLPEISRSDLSQLCLALRVMKIAGPTQIDWLDAPPAEAIQQAEALLDRLGATGGMEQRLARFPLAPRIARIVLEASDRGVGEDGCLAAALLSSGTRSEANDLLAAMDLPLDPRTRQLNEQLRRIARPAKQTHHDDDALLLSVLAGFPDRVARRRSGKQVLLASGTYAEIAGESPPYEFMIALNAENRTENAFPVIRMAARIEPEWLIDLFPAHIEERDTVTWNRASDRVEKLSALMYDSITLQESRGTATESEAADLLSRKAIEEGIARFVDDDALETFLARLSFAGLEPPSVKDTLRELCQGLHSFTELIDAGKGFLPLLESKINSRLLADLAPSTVKLSSGRQTKIHYETGRPPWIASRLQDFFGMADTPRIGPEKTPLVVHLLAPNQRAVQTTTDLAGFWDRLYPQVRRELMRRYPRHSWPERP